MNATAFMSISKHGLMRAEHRGNGDWSVSQVVEMPTVCCLAVDLCNRDVVYAGTRGDGLLRSDDCGKTWRQAGLAGQVVKSIALTPANPQVILAGTKPPAIWASYDGGQHWKELEAFRQLRRWFWFTPAEPGDPYVMGLAVSPTNPNVIVAGVEYGGMFRSTDGGQTWTGHLKGTSRDCHDLTFHHTNPDWVYQAGGGWPAAFSRDGGQTWSQPRKGMGWSIYGMACAADPHNPEVWYVTAAPIVKFPQLNMMPRMHWDGYSNSYIYRAAAGGRWERLGGGLPQPLNHAAYALVTDPDAPGHLYAGLSSGDVWHSANYGDTWTQLPFNLKGVHYDLVLFGKSR